MTQKKQQAGFDDWVDMWEKAQTDGTFDNAPKPPAQAGTASSFFGMQYNHNADVPPAEADTEYWNQVYQRSNHAGDSPDIAAPEVLQEQKKPVREEKKERKKGKLPERRPLPEERPIREGTTPENMEGRRQKSSLADIVKNQLRSPNPIYYYSAGKDQELHVTQNWAAGGKEIQELEEMKVKLQQLESKLGAMIGEGKPDRQVQKLESELRKLRDRVDELSNSLHGGWVGEVED